jgi:prepilin-type N-terminal cleavage/methylation domain-containing protein
MARHPKTSVTARAAKGGFTLTEVMIVLIIVSIIATMCVPTFQRAVEQSRADIAAANLRAIWAAERVYWLEYRAYTSGSGATSQLQQLQQLGLLDPAVASSNSGGYSYDVDGSGTAFTATATRDGVTMTIDANGEVTATGATIGFQ